MAKFLERVLEKMAVAGLAVSATSIVIMSLVIGAGAISRYLLNRPFGWLDEFAGGLLLPVFFSGLAYVFKEDQHIRITLIVDRLPRRGKDLFAAICSLLAILYGSIMTYEGVRLGMQMLKYNTSYVILPVSKFASEVFLPIGMAMFALMGIVVLLEQIKKGIFGAGE